MRRILSIWALAAIIGGLTASAVTIAAPAAAQTGYPPGQCTVTTGGQDAGSHVIGSSFSVTLAPACVFAPGSTVNLTVNGQSGGTKTADANGNVTVSVAIGGSPGAVTITVNPTVSGQCGANTIVATGTASTGQSVTQSATFNVVCQGAATTTSGSGLAFTGANLLRWGGIAAALIVAGGFMVVTWRRRSATI